MNDLERPDHIPADFALWEKAGHARPRVTLIWRRSAPIPCSASRRPWRASAEQRAEDNTSFPFRARREAYC